MLQDWATGDRHHEKILTDKHNDRVFSTNSLVEFKRVLIMVYGCITLGKKKKFKPNRRIDARKAYFLAECDSMSFTSHRLKIILVWAPSLALKCRRSSIKCKNKYTKVSMWHPSNLSPIVTVNCSSVEGSFSSFTDWRMSKAIAATDSVWWSFLTGTPLTTMYWASPRVSN